MSDNVVERVARAIFEDNNEDGPDTWETAEASLRSIYLRNARAAIEAMRSVLNPDGFIFLEGSVNEGQKQKYHGLHRWNFQPEADGDLIVWSQLSRISLREKYPEATINAIRQDQWYKVELSFPSNREDD